MEAMLHQFIVYYTIWNRIRKQVEKYNRNYSYDFNVVLHIMNKWLQIFINRSIHFPLEINQLINKLQAHMRHNIIYYSVLKIYYKMSSLRYEHKSDINYNIIFSIRYLNLTFQKANNVLFSIACIYIIYNIINGISC